MYDLVPTECKPARFKETFGFLIDTTNDCLYERQFTKTLLNRRHKLPSNALSVKSTKQPNIRLTEQNDKFDRYYINQKKGRNTSLNQKESK